MTVELKRPSFNSVSNSAEVAITVTGKVGKKVIERNEVMKFWIGNLIVENSSEDFNEGIH